MNKQPIYVGFLFAIAISLISIYYFYHSESSTESQITANSIDSLELNNEQPKPTISENSQVSDETKLEQVVSFLQQKYANVIDQPAGQMRLLESLAKQLQTLYPDDWQERIYELLTVLFPDIADALYAKFIALEDYKVWMASNRNDLTGLSRQERQEAIWQKRKELFGDDAELIWAKALQQQQLRDRLDNINQQSAMPINDQLDQYITDINAVYGEQADRLFEQRKQQVVDMFLNLESVQNKLTQLDRATQADQLRSIRSQLGLDKAALDRWQTLDQQRADRWQQGENYMQKRQTILDQFQGAQRDEKLRTLQDSMFGAEAITIRNEEADGYFRYNGKQIIGRN